MARFYVENKEHKWNIFSSIIDDFLFDDFVDFVTLKQHVIEEIVEREERELNTLLTDYPHYNIMPYCEAIEKIKMREDEEHEH